MKKLFVTATISLLLLNANAQTDSMAMKTGPFIIQANNAIFISSLLSNSEQLQEFIYGDIRDKFKSAGSPATNISLSIDSVKVSTLLALSSSLRTAAYRGSKQVYTRIDAAIRACNNSFLANRLNYLDKKDTDEYNERLTTGREKLSK